MPLPIPVFDLPGDQTFSGSTGDVINLPPAANLEVAEATIAFAFTANSVNSTQGLFTKDATGFAGGGNHLAIYIENGTLTARFQDGTTSTFLTFGGLAAGQEYEVAATFGANGIQLYVDGVLVGSDAGHIMTWTGNQEFLQVGGLGWGSQTGQDTFTNPFAGQIADVQVYGQVLNAAQIAELAFSSVPGNISPVAADDTATVAEDGSVTIAVLSNDTDADSDPVTISSLGTPANGSVSINDNGTPGDQTDDRIVYTPDADFNGTDSFTYTISDGRGGSATGTVDVTVTPEPDAPNAVNDSATAGVGTPVVIPVLANDNDPDGDTLQVIAVTQGTDGAVTINPDNTVSYTSGVGFTGTDSFTYTIDDGNGGTDTATVSISTFPTPVFDLPGDQTFSGSTGDVINLPPAANLEVAEATIAFAFTANSVNSTQGLFTKDATGFAGGGNHLAIYIENGTLTARFQDGTTSTFLTFGGLAAGQEYEVAATFGANGIQLYVDGVLVGSDAGHIMTWTGNQEFLQVGGLGWGSQTGQDTFTNPFAGQIADVQVYGQVLNAAQIAELAFSSVPGNISPVAADDTATVAEDGSVTIAVLSNDTDADSDPVTISSLGTPANGSVSINDNGTPGDQTDDRIVYTPDADFNGTDSFTYTISDGRGGSATGTVDVTVTPEPDAPNAVNDSATAGVGTPVVIPVLANDNDPDGDTLQVIAVTQGTDGAVTINPDNTVSYTSGVGFTGTDSFTYTIDDGNGGTDTATVSISTFPTPVFDLPGDQTFSGSTGDVINLPPAANLEVAEATIAFAFTANSVNSTQGLFTKDATGFAGGGNHLAIYIENGTLTARFQDGTTSTFLTFGGLAAGQEYEVAATFGANGIQLYVDGVLVGSDAGHIMTWTGNQEFLQVGGLGWGSQTGQDTFTNPFAGQIADVQVYGQVLNAAQIAELAFSSVPGNISPVAADDTATVAEDGSVTIAVLSNDTDADSDPVTISSLGTPANGSVSINDNGTPGDQTDDRIVYTPDADFNGTDSFTYTISDGRGGSATGTVDVTVTPEPDAPNAVNDSATAGVGTPVVIPVLANDNDPDGDTLQVIAVTQGTDGAVTINPDNTVSYTSGVGFTGTDSFTYTIDDGNGGTAQATATITVTDGSNVFGAISDDFADPSLDPVWNFSGITGSAQLGTSATDGFLSIISPAGVPVSASDSLTTPRVLQAASNTDFQVSAGFLTEPSQTFSEHGLLVVEDDQNFIRFDIAFTSNSNLRVIVGVTDNGNTSFELFQGISPGSVTDFRITRTGDDFVFETSSDGTNWTQVHTTNHVMTVSQVGVFAGSAEKNGVVPGYTAQIDYFENSAVPIVNEDGSIGGNADPVALDDALTTDLDVALSVDVAADLLANDTDPEGDPLSLDSFNSPANGTLIDNADGTLTYNPDAGFIGTDTFTYTVSDGNGGTDTATATITVFDPTNTAPTAADDAYVTDEDTVLTVAAGAGVLANDVDLDGDPLSLSVVSGPANGALNLAADGGFTYTPNADFNGADSFTYQIDDGRGGTSTATASLTVAPVNDAPVANDDTVTEQGTTPLVVPVLANDTDTDGDTLQVTAVTPGSNGAVAINPDGTVTYTPGVGFQGTDSFTYTVSDGNGGTDTATVTIETTNSAPVLVTGQSVFQRQIVDTTMPLTHMVVAADFDGDGDIDLASTSEQDDTVAWLENDGALNFTKQVIDANLDAAYPLSITDIDQDGDADILAGGYLADQYVLYENDGAGGFVKQILINDDGPHSIVAVDVDGDGDKDLVTASQDADAIAWHENVGGLNFVERLIDSGAGAAKTALTADVDGDGDIDIVTTEFGGDKVSWYANDGAGNFTTNVVDASANGAYFAVADDLDGDGSQDIVAAIQVDDTIAWYRNDGAENFTKIVIDDTADAARSVFTADMDGDGDIDVLAASVDDDTISFYENAGDGTFTKRVVPGPVDGPYGVEAFDVNRDGLLDVMSAGRNDGTISVHLQSKAHTLNLTAASTVQIDQNVLRAVDADNAPSELVFTLLTAPAAGELRLDGTALLPGGTFTQQDIDDNRLTYVHLTLGQNADAFTFTLADGGQGGLTPANGSLTINIVAPPPTAADDSATTPEDQAVSIDVLANDSDPGSLAISLQSVGAPLNGTAVIDDNGTPGNPDDDTILYTPGPDFFGADTFVYTLGNSNGGADTATVNVTVTPTQDAPDAIDDAATAAAGTPVIIPVLDNDIDVDGDTLLVTSVTQGADGGVVINPDGTVTYTPGVGYTGSDTFTYTVDDGNGGSDTATVSVSDFPIPVYELAGLQSFDGTPESVVNLPPDASLEIPEATVAFSFVANDVTPSQGLVTKDSSGFAGGGNHLAIYVDKDDLKVRFQDGSDSHSFVAKRPRRRSGIRGRRDVRCRRCPTLCRWRAGRVGPEPCHVMGDQPGVLADRRPRLGQPSGTKRFHQPACRTDGRCPNLRSGSGDR